MPKTASDDYLEPYRQAQRDRGTDFGVTLWANPQSQTLRFAVMAQMIDLTGKRILDAGCSRGDFAAYLADNRVAYAHYTGIDGLPEVVQFARTRPLPAAAFYAGDFVADPALLATGNPDIVAISGSLNTMQDDVADRVLESAWAAAGEALIFNFLSDRCGRHAPPQAYPARRLNTMRLLDWALAKTWSVTFRQDYFKNGHDATILMRKV